MINQLVSILTLAAMLLHASLGCHTHHAHSCQSTHDTTTAQATAPAAKGTCHGHTHVQPHAEAAHGSECHAPSEQSDHRNCEEDSCEFVVTPVTKLSPPDEQLSFDGDSALQIAPSLIASQLSINATHWTELESELQARCAPMQLCTQAWLL